MKKKNPNEANRVDQKGSKGNPSKTTSSTGPAIPKASEVKDAHEYVKELARADGLVLAHVPESHPEDEKTASTAVQAFQSNLLSLVSHELRTPLMGVLNALHMMEIEQGDPGFSNESGMSRADLLEMALRNATRLERSLLSLLDLASIESKNFHLKLKEVNLSRVGRSRVAQFKAKEKKINVTVEEIQKAFPVLGDPGRLGRAFDLIFESAAGLGATQIELKLFQNSFEVLLHLDTQSLGQWQQTFDDALAAVKGGLASPGSVFGQALQSEELFLSRSREGIGSEILLLHEIIRRHHGEVRSRISDRGQVTVQVELPVLSSEEGLRQVLSSRALAVNHELATVGLVLIKVPPKVEDFQTEVRKALFRSSDQAYALADSKTDQKWVALILDDCKGEDIPKLMERLQKHLGRRLKFGVASCPEDGLDPSELLNIASRRVQAGAP